MIARIEDVNGQAVASHRTYLTRDGNGKASVTPDKATLGPVRGGAVRLEPVAPEIVIGEGIESSASAGRLLCLLSWSALSAGNLGLGVMLPPQVRAVVIAADNDPPGLKAAKQASTRWRIEGRRVRVCIPDRAGADFNDLIRAGDADG